MCSFWGHPVYAAYCDGRSRSVVCQCVTELRCAKIAGRIEVLFGVETLGDRRHIVGLWDICCELYFPIVKIVSYCYVLLALYELTCARHDGLLQSYVTLLQICYWYKRNINIAALVTRLSGVAVVLRGKDYNIGSIVSYLIQLTALYRCCLPMSGV